MSEQNVIDNFDGEHAWMSNFYVSPIQAGIQEGTIVYNTVEHFYQAMKSQDTKVHAKIASLPHPGQAKRYGSKIELRPYWEDVKLEFMHRALQAKFRYPDLREKLLATGNAQLIEGNYWHDNTWGNCGCKKCVNIKGKNLLGGLLMEIRAHLRIQEVLDDSI